ncbi:MAG: hypothetical protein U5Q44_10665 [Dehalococcoidia bacterium]|nr:hypothetical protein [Dehalococcoidia bacterium]
MAQPDFEHAGGRAIEHAERVVLWCEEQLRDSHDEGGPDAP